MKEQELNQWVETARRQRQLKEELLMAQQALAADLHTDGRRLCRRGTGIHYAALLVAALLLAGMAEACTPSPDGCQQRLAGAASSDEVVASLDQIIDTL